MTEEVFTRDLSSGKVHRRYRMPDGSLASAEADNLDDAGAYELVDLAKLDEPDLCVRCFPTDVDPPNDDPVSDEGPPNDEVGP